jgi:hypothetical protein
MRKATSILDPTQKYCMHIQQSLQQSLRRVSIRPQSDRDKPSAAFTPKLCLPAVLAQARETCFCPCTQIETWECKRLRRDDESLVET